MLLVGVTTLISQTLHGVLTSAALDPATGTYTVQDRTTGWRLSGSVGGPVRNVRTGAGRDGGGPYRETSFEWTAETPLRGTIRLYDERPAAFFRLEYLAPRAKPVRFPDFTTIPQGLRGFSHGDEAFFPGRFRLADTSTPWLLFDRSARSMILSPASQFLVAKMVGDGKASVGVSLNDRLSGVPKGLDQDSLLAFGAGVGRAWEGWGGALRALYGRNADAAAKDPVAQKFGYWTDNGADYYYHYENDKGYAGTLLALLDRYRKAGLPVGYLQLDSWWYRKLSNGADGKRSNERKVAAYPLSDWNRYGGTLEYRAVPELFPDGLAAFSKRVGLPIAVHGRWIDVESPLREKYKVSGVAPVDPNYWKDTAAYLASSGVRCYEQDWLDHLYNYSPEMFTTVGVADAFADGMAKATRAKGMTMQYCMAQPRFVLNGVRYPNLTTVRTSPDRFERGKWAQFVLGIPLTRAIGALPWADVFRSRETGNCILATLSAGTVGTGDAIGTEEGANILRIARPDGVIVRPDEPLVPTDATYLALAEDAGAPFVAHAFTEQGGLRTRYLFAFGGKSPASLALRSLGSVGRFYVADLITGEGRWVEADDDLTLAPGEAGFAYRMVAPATKTGIAFLGDWGKFVPTGKARVASIEDRAEGLRVRVSFAKGEGAVTLEGVSPKSPRVLGARLLRYDAATGRFAVEVAGEGEVVLDGRG